MSPPPIQPGGTNIPVPEPSYAEQLRSETASRPAGSTSRAATAQFPGLPLKQVAARPPLHVSYIDGEITSTDARKIATTRLTRPGTTAAEAGNLLEEMEFMDRAQKGAAPERWMYLHAIAISDRQGDRLSLDRVVDMALEREALPEWIRDIDPSLLDRNRSSFSMAIAYVEGEKTVSDLFAVTFSQVNSSRPDWEGAMVCLASLKWAQSQRPGFEIPLRFYSRLIRICEAAGQLPAVRLALQDLADRGLIPEKAVQNQDIPWEKSNLYAVAEYIGGDLAARDLISLSRSQLMKFHNQHATAAMALLSNLAWADAKRPGVKPPPRMYQGAMIACAQVGDATGALALRRHMIDHDVDVDEEIDSAALFACAKAAQQAADACAGDMGDPTEAGLHADTALQLETIGPRGGEAKRRTIQACRHAAVAFAASDHVQREHMAAKYADQAMSVLTQSSADVEPDMLTVALQACGAAVAAGSKAHVSEAVQFYEDACKSGLPVNWEALSTVVSILVGINDEMSLQRAAALMDESVSQGLCHDKLGRKRNMISGNLDIELHLENIFTDKNCPDFERDIGRGVPAKVAKAVLEHHWSCHRLKPGPDGTVLSFGTGDGKVRQAVIEWLDLRGFAPVDFILPNGRVQSNLLRFKAKAA